MSRLRVGLLGVSLVLGACERDRAGTAPEHAPPVAGAALVTTDVAPETGSTAEERLTRLETTLGLEHPETIAARIHHAARLRARGNTEGAARHSDRALALWEKNPGRHMKAHDHLGHDRPETAASLENLGLLLFAMGDRAGAKSFLSSALSSHQRHHGEGHPLTRRVRQHLVEGLGGPELAGAFAPLPPCEGADCGGVGGALPSLACRRGTVGCGCVHPHACDAGLTCRWQLCWDGDVPVSETYYLTDQAQADPAIIRDLVAEHFDLQPGDHAADIGCGQGSLTLALSQATGPTGKVYATDIAPPALEQTRAYVAQSGSDSVAEVETRLATSRRDTGLEAVADGTLQLIVMINSVHFERTESREDDRRYLQRFLRKLVPGGRLVYHFDWLEPSRLPVADFEALLVSAGFDAEIGRIAMPDHIPEATFLVNDGPRAHLPKPLKRGFISVSKRPIGPLVPRD